MSTLPVKKDSSVLRMTLMVSFFLLLALLCLISSACTPADDNGDDAAEETRSPPVTPTPRTSWLILPAFPASATAADVGAEIYRLVCRDCHGDNEQGLTAEFRATWAPKDQNCWQSKCHSLNHPPDGFLLPRFIKGIIGPTALTRFYEPEDLFEFIRVTQPWHNPGSLTDDEYWQLTAFIVRENGGDPSGLPSQ